MMLIGIATCTFRLSVYMILSTRRLCEGRDKDRAAHRVHGPSQQVASGAATPILRAGGKVARAQGQ